MNEFYYRAAKTLGQNLFCCPCSALVTDLSGKVFPSIFFLWMDRPNLMGNKIEFYPLYFSLSPFSSDLQTIHSWIGQEVASYWYSTVRRYNYFKDISLLHTNVNAGHFTQMVWMKTKYFGIGKATSQTGKIFVVAYYYPPGKCWIWNY